MTKPYTYRGPMPLNYLKRRELQREGIEKAKARGAYRGRSASIDREAVKELWDEGLGATKIARILGIGRASVYRVLAEPPSPPIVRHHTCSKCAEAEAKLKYLEELMDMRAKAAKEYREIFKGVV